MTRAEQLAAIDAEVTRVGLDCCVDLFYNARGDCIAEISEHTYRYAAGFGDAVSVQVNWNPRNHANPSKDWRGGNAYVYGVGTPNYPMPAIPINVDWIAVLHGVTSDVGIFE